MKAAEVPNQMKLLSCYKAGFDDGGRGSWAKERGSVGTEKAKETDSALEPPEKSAC